jgi:hypothetical protein
MATKLTWESTKNVDAGTAQDLNPVNFGFTNRQATCLVGRYMNIFSANARARTFWPSCVDQDSEIGSLLLAAECHDPCIHVM